MRLFVWRPLTIAVIVSGLPAPAYCAPFEMKLFGHNVSISASDDQYKLEMDGREVLKSYYVDLDEMHLWGSPPAMVWNAKYPLWCASSSVLSTRTDGTVDHK